MVQPFLKGEEKPKAWIHRHEQSVQFANWLPASAQLERPRREAPTVGGTVRRSQKAA